MKKPRIKEICREAVAGCVTDRQYTRKATFDPRTFVEVHGRGRSSTSNVKGFHSFAHAYVRPQQWYTPDPKPFVTFQVTAVPIRGKGEHWIRYVVKRVTYVEKDPNNRWDPVEVIVVHDETIHYKKEEKNDAT